MEHHPLSGQLLLQLFDFPKAGQKCRERMRFSPSEIVLLGTLVYRRSTRDTTITMSEISELLGVSKPAATQLVLRLCLKGLLERFHDERDRRVIRVQLAPQASHLIEEHIESLLTSVDRVIVALGEEKSRQLLELQQEFHRALFDNIVCSAGAGPNSTASDPITHREAIV